VHIKKIKYDQSIDLRVIARGTVGFTGAKLASLVNEAALIAARRNKAIVSMEHLEYAKDKILMGVEHKSMAMTDLEKERTAYHEAGHAIVGLYSPDYPPIHKATIVPRGGALGMVMPLPETDCFSETKTQMISFINTAMGGKAAEEIIYGADNVTSGGSQDIKMATHKARAMVTQYGLSDDLGHVFYGSEGEGMFGPNGSSGMGNSEHTARIIDSEIKNILDSGFKFAKSILNKHLDQLHILAKSLIENETLSGKQIKNLLSGKDINFEGDVEFPKGKKYKKKLINPELIENIKSKKLQNQQTEKKDSSKNNNKKITTKESKNSDSKIVKNRSKKLVDTKDQSNNKNNNIKNKSKEN
jgi:cell division protease FtsH